VSGHLITQILLGLRLRAELRVIGRLAALKEFHLRRSLRILPPFCLVLAAACLVGIADAWDYVLWHAL
jgi:peptidoglycan/LPS O-acetylase OafA/YrhL